MDKELKRLFEEAGYCYLKSKNTIMVFEVWLDSMGCLQTSLIIKAFIKEKHIIIKNLNIITKNEDDVKLFKAIIQLFLEIKCPNNDKLQL